jgi:hypothetical protein
MNRKSREAVFFIMIFCVIYLSISARAHLLKMYEARGSGQEELYINIGLVLCLTLVILGLYHLAKLQNSSEPFWDVSPEARCKGGLYLMQGDSDRAKACRAMTETEAGRCALASQNCPTGFNGVPRVPFYYSRLSDDSYESERCKDAPACACKGADTMSRM